MRGAHQEVLARRGAVGHLDAVRGPAELGGVYVAAAHADALALAQGLDAVQPAVLDDDVAAVPERGAAELGHVDVPQLEAAVVPERVAQVHEGAVDHDVVALLEGALAVRGTVEAAVADDEASLPVQGALRVEGPVLDGLVAHGFLSSRRAGTVAFRHRRLVSKNVWILSQGMASLPPPS